MNNEELKQILEAVLFAADEPLNMNRLMSLFPEDNHPGRDAIKQAIAAIQNDYAKHSLELKQVGSGYRFQVKQEYAQALFCCQGFMILLNLVHIIHLVK